MPSELSINYTGKKKEAERIDRENALMIQRLVRQQSSINSKHLAKDYAKHLEFKRRHQIATENCMKAEDFIEKRKINLKHTVGTI